MVAIHVCVGVQIIGYLIRLHEFSDHLVMGLCLGSDLASSVSLWSSGTAGSMATSMVSTAVPEGAGGIIGAPQQSDSNSVSALMGAMASATAAANVSSSPNNAMVSSAAVWLPTVFQPIFERSNAVPRRLEPLPEQTFPAHSHRAQTAGSVDEGGAGAGASNKSYQHIWVGRLKAERYAVAAMVVSAVERHLPIHAITYVNMGGRYTAVRQEFHLFYTNPGSSEACQLGAYRPQLIFENLWTPSIDFSMVTSASALSGVSGSTPVPAATTVTTTTAAPVATFAAPSTSAATSGEFIAVSPTFVPYSLEAAQLWMLAHHRSARLPPQHAWDKSHGPEAATLALVPSPSSLPSLSTVSASSAGTPSPVPPPILRGSGEELDLLVTSAVGHDTSWALKYSIARAHAAGNLVDAYMGLLQYQLLRHDMSAVPTIRRLHATLVGSCLGVMQDGGHLAAMLKGAATSKELKMRVKRDILTAQFLSWRESVYRVLNGTTLVMFAGLRDKLSNVLSEVYDKVVASEELTADASTNIETVVRYLHVIAQSACHFFHAACPDSEHTFRQFAAEVRIADRAEV